MGEILSDPTRLPPPESEPELEQLADWIIRHETLPGEPERRATATPAEELTEIKFERRHEVKEAPEEAPQAKLQPMTPISQVLQTRSLLPDPPSKQQQAATVRRLRGLLRPSNSRYATAVLQGFATGLVIIVIVAVILAARLLAQNV